jgi:predicted dehydrogenase
MPHPSDHPKTGTSRRDFLKTTSAFAGATALAGLSIQRGAHAAENNQLKVGLIGCGGRGTGAAVNALTADPNTVLTAMGDAFEDRLTGSAKRISEQFPDRVQVPKERQFVGFDAFEKVIGSGVDVVLLATSPHFRPQHLKAAIEADKHVFCEKPVAVDAPGVRSVLESSKLAEEKGLSLVSGLCWRYHHAVKETMQRILDGAIGDVLSIQSNYLTGPISARVDQIETEMSRQMRNWYFFTWLSGDFNVEQHVHSLDKALWAFRDEPPLQAYGLGGRQTRIEQPKFGHIYDHMSVIYEYPDGKKVHSYCRQQEGCYNMVSDELLGTKGRAVVTPKHEIEGENPWRFQGDGGNMYVLEHEALFQSIRSGEPINNGVYMARSTMMGILGRMVCYTGKTITWEEAMASTETLSPSSYAWDAEPPILPDADGKYPVAMPGQTKFI